MEWYKLLEEIKDDESYLKQLEEFLYRMWYSTEHQWEYKNYKSHNYLSRIRVFIKKLSYTYTHQLWGRENEYNIITDKKLCNDIYNVINNRYLSLEKEIEEKKSRIEIR
jgi:hypothetical protein